MIDFNEKFETGEIVRGCISCVRSFRKEKREKQKNQRLIKDSLKTKRGSKEEKKEIHSIDVSNVETGDSQKTKKRKRKEKKEIRSIDVNNLETRDSQKTKRRKRKEKEEIHVSDVTDLKTGNSQENKKGKREKEKKEIHSVDVKSGEILKKIRLCHSCTEDKKNVTDDKIHICPLCMLKKDEKNYNCLHLSYPLFTKREVGLFIKKGKDKFTIKVSFIF